MMVSKHATVIVKQTTWSLNESSISNGCFLPENGKNITNGGHLTVR